MSDLFNEKDMQQPAVPEGETKQVPTVTPASAPVTSARRRRVDRNRDAQPETPAASTPEAPARTTHAILDDLQPTQANRPTVPPVSEGDAPRFQTRYNPTTPSQGVPRPASLQGMVRRPAAPEQSTGVRRPITAQGYSPIQPLGKDRLSDSQPIQPPMPVQPVQERPLLEEEDGHNGGGGGRGLVAAIIALLVLAALIVGLILIPEEGAGFLSDVKRTVTEPIRGLLSGEKDVKNNVPAQASGFTANLTQDVSPYKIVFNLETSRSVTDVRVVDAEGNAMPTKKLLSYPYNDNTIVWQFEMTLETAYEGIVHAQILDGTTWLDTGRKLMLNIGTGAPSTISNVPQNTVVLMTNAATATPALTAGSTTESTVSPSITATATAKKEHTASPVPFTQAPVVITTPIPTPTIHVTATPTLSMTATPTLMPTATPSETPSPEPTEAPTQAPTPAPTEAPTPEPTQAPTPTPKLEAHADESADPSLISTQKIYVGTKATESFTRDAKNVINMPAGDDYLTLPFGVMTYRGNAFRQNAASGYVTDPTSLSSIWTAEAGSLAAKSRTFYGFSWGSQPAIIRWTKEIRPALNLPEERRSQTNLKEVILAGQDGKIYFLDLNNGTATREAIDFGFPMRSAPSVHSLGYPVMAVGQYGRFLKDKSGDIGLYYYNLLDQKELRMIDGLDGKTDRQYNNVGAFDTSALFDRNSNTLIAVGTNGLLYTEKLNMQVYMGPNGYVDKMDFDTPEQVVLMSHTRKQSDEDAAVESSLAMYGSYAYYADLDGILRCVDTTTMTTMWAVDTGDAVKAAIALDLDPETNTLWLYTANILDRASKGDVTIRRYNAMTGKEDWAFAVQAQKKNGMKDSYGSTVTSGAMASPVIGQNSLKDLVYFTLSGLSAEGAKDAGLGDEALNGVLLALDKASGKVVWHKNLDTYAYSSPVAVYSKEGQGWIIQAAANGTLYLLDGLTGQQISTLQLNGTIEASPAVYGDTLVIGTTGKGTSYIYGVRIK